MTSWLSEDLKEEIRRVFEPKYNRLLSETEIQEIAENLSSMTETILKSKLKYEKGHI